MADPQTTASPPYNRRDLSHSTPRRIKDLPRIEVTIEPNVQGTQLVWHIRASDGTKASGFAKCPADAMRDAAAFVEAMAQPRAGGMGNRALRVVGESA